MISGRPESGAEATAVQTLRELRGGPAGTEAKAQRSTGGKGRVRGGRDGKTARFERSIGLSGFGFSG
jgi:hypothetical protein